MGIKERIIAPEIQEDGSVLYRSVMSPPDGSVAVCYMVSQRVIPVVFVPGVMGSNLAKARGNREPIWLLDSAAKAASWIPLGAADRKRLLDPEQTSIYNGGKLPTGTTLSDTELRRRGWGEVAYISYGEFLVWLENALNDTHRWQTGLRTKLMQEATTRPFGVAPLTREEAALSYKYRLPVHAVGYNWLESNQASAQRLQARIAEFMAHYRRQGFMCERAILVTHSMGGLVGRYYTELLGGHEHVLGVVHGVMPATGSATAYKRVTGGTEKPAGWVLGGDAEEMTAVFAQSPGPLQLLPTPEYGMHWLKFRDGNRTVSLPQSDPYSEIYAVRGKWWSLCDDKLINPLDREKKTIDKDWNRYADLVINEVKPFHLAIRRRYHENTYAFYGDDPEHKSWGDVTWQRRPHAGIGASMGILPLDDPRDGKVVSNKGTGEVGIHAQRAGHIVHTVFQLKGPDENGDGTVPRRSGAAPAGQTKVCLAYQGVDHEGAYKTLPQRLFTLWSIVKITDAVKQTPMAYRR
ncbi:esterase/lipase family protein [Cupriavidus campinensis]